MFKVVFDVESNQVITLALVLVFWLAVHIHVLGTGVKLACSGDSYGKTSLLSIFSLVLVLRHN